MDEKSKSEHSSKTKSRKEDAEETRSEENASGEESLNRHLADAQAEAEKAEQAQKLAQNEVEALRKEILYLKADFENYRSRMRREQEQSIRFANEKFITELIGIVNHLDRALEHSESIRQDKQQGEKVTTVITGVDLTRRELGQMLNRFGVEFIGSAGEVFDPNRHEAVSHREVEEAESDKVLEVVQKGCLLHGRLLKPARVIVGLKRKS